MKKKQVPSFSSFLKLFPEIDLPVTLNAEDFVTYSGKNLPLSPALIDAYIDNKMDEEENEFVEYVPCFRIKDTFEMYALVFYKADLMNYEYILSTYTKKGALVDRKIIAGLRSNGIVLTNAIANIDPEWIIYIVEGMAKSEDKIYNASESKKHYMELLANGQIILLEK